MDISTLVKQARLRRITERNQVLDQLREMFAGEYAPANGELLPKFTVGSSRHEAFNRAVRTTSSVMPTVMGKHVAALDFAGITWSDAEGSKDAVDEALGDLPLAEIARDLTINYRLGGATAAMASTPALPTGRGEPVISVLHGFNMPYAEAHAPKFFTGWYRAIQFSDDSRGGRLRWWVEAFDFNGDATQHRVWRSLDDPGALAVSPDDEFTSAARPRFALYDLAPDGMPISPVLASLGRILGLYASELRLATTEELSAYPMLVTKGDVDVTQVGPGEVIATDANGDASWLNPGSLEELREQVRLKRDQVREALNLPGGSLGTGADTPSGEALEEANRGFVQETTSTADAVSGILTEVCSDYLALLGLPPVDVTLPIDRSYTMKRLIEIVEKGADLQAVPMSVTARMFQQFLGSHYSDEELQEHLAGEKARAAARTPGFLDPRDDRQPPPPRVVEE